MKQVVYLDNAATTKVRPEVLEEMLPYFTEYYGNPSSVYEFSSSGKEAIAKARERIAASLGAKSGEIYFTGGGSEADNWALIAAAEAYEEKGKHIITTSIEHHAILHTCEYLKKRGFEITYLPVDDKGLVSPEEVEAAIRPDTILISVMFANNEIGTIEPIKEIGAVARKAGVLFHTDAVQAYGHEPISVDDCKIDLLSASGHKFYGPKGVGFLYIRKGVRLHSFLHGGAQERGRRAGTENVPGIVGMGKAAELAAKELLDDKQHEEELRNYLIQRILAEIPDSLLNGHETKRLSNNVNITFRSVKNEPLLVMLDMEGICASGGSACTSGSLNPSHVLTAIGLSEEDAMASLRMTLSRETTKDELDLVVESLKKHVEKLRQASRLYERG